MPEQVLVLGEAGFIGSSLEKRSYTQFNLSLSIFAEM
jgi:hypothetical protein